MSALKLIVGKLTCWYRGHHIDGHKRRSTVAEQSKYPLPYFYVYECSRCGRLRDAPYPVKRVKK